MGLNEIERYCLFPPCVVAESGLFTIDLSRRRAGGGTFAPEKAAVFLLMEEMIEFV